MRNISFTEFRKDASALFSSIEKGESLVIIRHGKPIAEILPYRGGSDKTPSWKKKSPLLSIKGKALSASLIADREDS